MTSRDFPVGSALPLDVSGSGEPAPARPAATVMLLRDGDRGLEVFMLRRVPGMAFAPSMHVFPGGGVDARDAGDDLPWAGPSAQEWAAELGCDEDLARGVLAAAAREVFEETGVLLASGDGADAADPLSRVGDAAGIARTRAALVGREIPFADVLRDAGLRLRTDLLTYRAHWITPVVEPRRYDTYFFVAEVPAGQDPDGETSEADHAAWLRPADLLAAHAAGEALMLPPTIVCLEQLAEAARVTEALARPVSTAAVMPQLVDTATGPAMRVELP